MKSGVDITGLIKEDTDNSGVGTGEFYISREDVESLFGTRDRVDVFNGLKILKYRPDSNGAMVLQGPVFKFHIFSSGSVKYKIEGKVDSSIQATKQPGDKFYGVFTSYKTMFKSKTNPVHDKIFIGNAKTVTRYIYFKCIL